jgi:hypothetical protein
VREQHEDVLMQRYNELQLRSAKAEAMGMNFQKRVAAGAVAKAGFRQKPGPKKKARKSGGAEPMASILCHTHAVLLESLASKNKLQQRQRRARKLTKVAKDNFRETMEVKHREGLARLGSP